MPSIPIATNILFCVSDAVVSEIIDAILVNAYANVQTNKEDSILFNFPVASDQSESDDSSDESILSEESIFNSDTESTDQSEADKSGSVEFENGHFEELQTEGNLDLIEEVEELEEDEELAQVEELEELEELEEDEGLQAVEEIEEVPIVQNTENKVADENELRKNACNPDTQKNVEKDTNVPLNASTSKSDCYTNEMILSKGFTLRVFGKVRILSNLSLMSKASQIKKCEIQCFGLPEHSTENELLPLFDQYGKVYQLTKVMDSSNQVFVVYTCKEDAEKAIAYLHRSVYKGKLIQARKNLAGRIFVAPIPSSVTKREVFEKFKLLTHGLVNVSLINDRTNEGKIRNFCYLDYNDRLTARDAKNALSKKIVFGKKMNAEWPKKNQHRSDTSNTVYIHNLRPGVRCSDLRKYFSVYGKVRNIQRFGTFSSIHFEYGKDAVRGANEIDKKLLGNENVEISLTKLSKTSKKMLHLSSDTLYMKNLCDDMTNSFLQECFSVYGEIREIKKDGAFATVRFKKPQDAIQAAHKIDKQQLGRNIEISLEKHANKKSKGKRANKKLKKKQSNASGILFIKNLRVGITVSDVRQCFSVCGEIFEIDKEGTSATVRFKNPNDSIHAATKIDKQQLGHEVEISLEEKLSTKIPNLSDTLFIKNLPEGWTASDLRKYFSVYGQVIEVDKNNNFATVRFLILEDANRALHEFDKKKLGVNVKISFYKKDTDSDTLYLKNIRPGLTTADLRKYFSVYGKICEIDKDDTLATVKFQKLESSKRAAREIDKKTLGENADISFSNWTCPK